MLTGHALARVAERLTEDERAIVAARVETLTREHAAGAVAARILRLTDVRGTPWGEQSNGSDVWAVIRGGHVATVMLRRRTQPMDRRAFDVDRVLCVE